MTYTEALRDATRVSRAMRCRVTILRSRIGRGYDWQFERQAGGSDVRPGWRIVSVIDRGQL